MILLIRSSFSLVLKVHHTFKFHYDSINSEQREADYMIINGI